VFSLFLAKPFVRRPPQASYASIFGKTHFVPTIAEGWARRDLSLFASLRCALPKTHSGAAAVLVDELDARSYQMFGAD
jgi:hypothetical protein